MKILVDIEKYKKEMRDYHSQSEIETEIEMMKRAATNDCMEIDEDFLENEFRLIISYVLMGYDCPIEKADWEMMLDELVNAVKKSRKHNLTAPSTAGIDLREDGGN